MPKRKRRDKEPTTRLSGPAATAPVGDQPAGEAPAIDPSVALFAQRHQEGIEREKAQQRARATEKAKAGEHARLVAAKDEAVATMKRLARASSTTGEQKAESEAAYRRATADLIAHETGNRPTWAPTQDEPAQDSTSDAGAAPDEEAESTVDVDAETDGHAEAEGSTEGSTDT